MKIAKTLVSAALCIAISVSAAVPAYAAEKTSQSASKSVTVDNFTYTPPEREVLQKGLKRSGSSFVLSLNKKGRWTQSTENEYYDAVEQLYIGECLSVDYYNEIVKERGSDDDELKSYEAYKEYVLGTMGLKSYSKPEAKVYFFIDDHTYFKESEKPEIPDGYALRAIEYAFEKSVENDKLAKRINSVFAKGSIGTVSISYEYAGNNIINVFLSFSDYSSKIRGETLLDVSISADGMDGIILGNTFVPSDTEELCISSREKYIVEWLGNVPEGCLIACAGEYDSEEPVFDIAEMAKKLPKLKKLYVHQAVLKNEKKITNMKNLEVLSYRHSNYTESGYIEDMNDTPFAGMKSIKELRIYGDFKSYKFLDTLPSLEKVSAEVSGKDAKKLKKLFNCPYITDLSISGCTDISGIEKLEKLTKLEIKVYNELDITPLGKLTNLRELELETNGTDFAPLGKLTGMEKLTIIMHGESAPKNLSAIASMKKLKYLMLNGLDRASASDWAVLEKLTSLEQLDIMYSNGNFTGSLGKMTWLKHLSLSDIGSGFGHSYDMSFLPKLKSLETIYLMGNRVSLDGVSKLKKLKQVSIWLCHFSDLSELKKCPKLESLIIYNNDSDFDCNWIAGSKLKNLSFSVGSSGGLKNMTKIGTIKTLKELYLDFTGISEAEAKKLKKALLECVIEVYEVNGETVRY